MNKEENENVKKIRLLQELADSLFFEEDVKPFLNELADLLKKYDFYLQIDYDAKLNNGYQYLTFYSNKSGCTYRMLDDVITEESLRNIASNM